MYDIYTERLWIKPLSIDDFRLFIDEPLSFAMKMELKLSIGEMQDRDIKDLYRIALFNMKNDPDNIIWYTNWIIIFNNTITGGFLFQGPPDDEGRLYIRYSVDSMYQSMGIMTETISALLEWLKKWKTVHMLCAETPSANTPAQVVLEKNGFRIFSREDNIIKWEKEIK